MNASLTPSQAETVQLMVHFRSDFLYQSGTNTGGPTLGRVAIQILSLMSLQNMVLLDLLMSPTPTDRVRLLWPVGGCSRHWWCSLKTGEEVWLFCQCVVTLSSSESSDRGRVGHLSTPACCSGWLSRAVKRRGQRSTTLRTCHRAELASGGM